MQPYGQAESLERVHPFTVQTLLLYSPVGLWGLT